MPIPEIVGSLAMGLLGAGGQVATNRANVKIAREQMRFQERMSSTAAQRAAADYAAAGLNPALAYDRPASSPGGASTTLGDVAEAGVSTALQAKQTAAQLRLLHEQTRTAKATADVEAHPLTVQERQTAARHEARSRTVLADTAAATAERDFKHRSAMQPVDERIRNLEEMMLRYSVPGLTRSALSRIVPWVTSTAEGWRPGRGPEMKFEAALPSVNRDPSPFNMQRYRP